MVIMGAMYRPVRFMNVREEVTGCMTHRLFREVESDVILRTLIRISPKHKHIPLRKVSYKMSDDGAQL